MSIVNKTFFALAAAGVLLLASLLLADDFAPAVANAETVRTKKSARVMSRPKGSARVVARVGSGRDLVVVSRQGRWLKVKVNGKTGWVIKSATSATRSARPSVSKTRRRPVVTRRKSPAKSVKKKKKKKKTASRSAKKPVAAKPRPVVKVEKRPRPDNLDDDEEFLDEEEIEAAAKAKRVAAREKKDQLRREREERERKQEEAARLERERRQRARKERERKRRELDMRRREHEERRERDLAEERDREERDRDRSRRKKKSRADDYEDLDVGDDDDDDDDREPRRRRSRDEDDARDRDRRRYDDGDDDDDDDDEEDSPRRRRVVVVNVDAAEVHAKPSRKSRELGLAEDGEKLYVVSKSRSGAWLMVEDQSGDTGWIRASDVKAGSEGGGDSEESSVVARGAISAGYTTLESMFSSNGVGELANYEFSTAAASVVLVGEVAVHSGAAYVLAVDARYSGTRADPGIRFMNSSGQVADIALTNHEVDAGASIGLRLSKSLGTVFSGRVGYHYGMLSIDEVSNFDVNLAMLPSEVLKGMTVGGELDIPKFGDSLGISVAGDVLYPNGTRIQTDGLEDGAQAKVFAAWATAHLTYRTKARITIDALYRYSYATTEWTGTVDSSLRPHNASEAKRKDISHTALLGIGRNF